MTSQYDMFLYWLGQLETGNLKNPEVAQPKNQCHKIENAAKRTGRIGKYQLGEQILQDLRYYALPKFTTVESNLWKGKWLGRRGINSLEDYLYNCDAQEYILREEMNFLWGRIRLNKLDGPVGETAKGILITESGLLAGTHMFGISGLMRLLQGTKSLDATERNLLNLLKAFSGFQTPYGRIFPRNHSKSEFIRYIKTGLPPRISESIALIPQESTTTYVWCTQGDDRVRDSHASKDGETFDANDPPATGNPGDDDGCRCWSRLDISSDFLLEDLGDLEDSGEKPEQVTPILPTRLSVSPSGVDFMARWEGFGPKVYLDSARKPTIGYGHLLKPGESYPNGITRGEALQLFENEATFAERAVREKVTAELTQQQYDALVSFVYNVGTGAFEHSTLLRLLNQGKYAEAAEQFMIWNKVTVDGKVTEDPGLTNRRASERELFERGIYD